MKGIKHHYDNNYDSYIKERSPKIISPQNVNILEKDVLEVKNKITKLKYYRDGIKEQSTYNGELVKWKLYQYKIPGLKHK